VARFLLLIFALSFVAVASGQDRIYRATPIDLEQDARLDKLETETQAKFDALTKSIERLSKAIEGKAETLVAQSVLEAPKPIADPVSDAVDEPRYCLGDTKYCDGRLHYLACVNGNEKWLPVPAPSIQLATAQPVVQAPTVTYSQPVTVQRSVTTQSSRYSMSELRALIQQHRNHRIYDDVQPRSDAYRHLTQDHGFSSDQVNGLTLDEAYRLHGLAHGGIVRATRSSESVAMVQASVQSAPVYSYPVTQQIVNVQPVRTPVRTVVQAAASGCANGQCPTQRSTGGWSLFGRFR
jgi:hypothetical protein